MKKILLYILVGLMMTLSSMAISQTTISDTTSYFLGDINLWNNNVQNISELCDFSGDCYSLSILNSSTGDGTGTDDQTLSYNSATNEITIEDGNSIDISEVDTDTTIGNCSGDNSCNNILYDSEHTLPLHETLGLLSTNNESNLNVNYSDDSDKLDGQDSTYYLDNTDTSDLVSTDNYNSTQFDETGSQFNVKTSWITTLINTLIDNKVTQSFINGLFVDDLTIDDYEADTNCTDDNSCPLITYDSELSYTVDTNETTRMDNIADFSCTSDQKISSFGSDATPVCTADTNTDTQLTEDQVEAYIFDSDNTDNLDMTTYNISMSTNAEIYHNGTCLIIQVGDTKDITCP